MKIKHSDLQQAFKNSSLAQICLPNCLPAVRLSSTRCRPSDLSQVMYSRAKFTKILISSFLSLAFLILLCSAKKARSLPKKVLIEVLISCNGFCYDVTIKLYQHHMIKRVTHAVDTCRMLLMYSMYFVVVTLLSQLLAKHSWAALPCK